MKETLIWALIITGASAIFTPPLVYPDLTPMQLLTRCWGYYIAGILLECLAVVLMRIDFKLK